MDGQRKMESHAQLEVEHYKMKGRKMKTHCKLEPNCRPKFTRGRLAASAFMSALIGLSALLPTQTVQAQLTPCATGLFDGITWRESTVHIGDTVHFTMHLDNEGLRDQLPPEQRCGVWAEDRLPRHRA